MESSSRLSEPASRSLLRAHPPYTGQLLVSQILIRPHDSHSNQFFEKLNYESISIIYYCYTRIFICSNNPSSSMPPDSSRSCHFGCRPDYQPHLVALISTKETHELKTRARSNHLATRSIYICIVNRGTCIVQMIVQSK